MIIGLGFKARAGKDTVGAYLVHKYGFVQESFAYPLKEYIGKKIFGFNEKQLYGSLKEVVDPVWGKTPRQILQLAGTDALRNKVHNDVWVISMKRKVREHMNMGNQFVVITDVRFKNEAQMIKDMGGVVIRVHRDFPDQISNTKHSSELELENYDGWNHIINNNGTLDELFAQVDEIIVKNHYHTRLTPR